MDKNPFLVKTDPELFEAYRNNMIVVSTAINELFGDEPLPDPRETAHWLSTMTYSLWEEMWMSPDAKQELRKNFDMLKAVQVVQNENVLILAAMLARH